ncbi:MAG: hypothetical protein U9R57_07345 [Thermodesulfobacteriota bacterium]|nr:hypothetical protein [Thermodesulfobacteriota bacterium]
MPTVKKATLEMLGQIYPLLQHFGIRELNQNDWQRLLEKRWSNRFDHFGYVLLEEEQVVGFLGTFFYERKILGKTHDFCNLFCWIVPEEHRKSSLFLLLAVLNIKDLTVTSLTASREASLILKQFKFKTLETDVKIFPVFLSLSPGRGTVLYSAPETIRSRLNKQDLALYTDHNLASCEHLLAVNKDNESQYCYLIYNTVRKKNLRFTQIYFISNSTIFKKAFSPIQHFFLKHNRTLFTVIDKRLTGSPSPGPGFNYTLRYPRLYRSKDIQASQIDNLYTELVFLKKI